MTRVHFPNVFRDVAVDLKTVVNEEFVAGPIAVTA
jgi:hypothetical protein